MKSPFKFLDPFTLDDKDNFFGREREEKALFRLVQKTKLVIVYGLSGTGKTSLIQCGLARQFEGPDWLPVFIRRQNDIQASLDAAIDKLLTDADGKSGSLSTRINKLYRMYYRPVYLVFDQFEELFIFGKEAERFDFIRQIRDVLDNECPCTIIISIREEYLGQMYLFERAIPTFFDYRLRIEPMSGATVRRVLDASCKQFGITVEPMQAVDVDKYDAILKSVNGDKATTDLPYLQVYMDRFYKEDFERTYPNGAQNTEGVWLPIEFTQQEIADFGTIENVLDKFLDEQLKHVQEHLFLDNGTPVQADLAKRILDAFVSDEGTKRPIRIVREGGLIVVDETGYKDFSHFDPLLLTQCVQYFENARLLRVNDESMELAHDSLAKIIDSKRTEDERLLNDITKLIKTTQQLYDTTFEYLSPNDLVLIQNYANKLKLNPDLQAFIAKSKVVRDEEHQENEAKMKADLAREKGLKHEAMLQKDIAEKAREQAEILADVAKKAREKTMAEKKKVQLAFIVLCILSCCMIFALGYGHNMKVKADEAAQKERTGQKEKVEKEVKDLLEIAEILKKSQYSKQAHEKLEEARTILEAYEDNPNLLEVREDIDSLLKKY